LVKQHLYEARTILRDVRGGLRDQISLLCAQ
jgi:hypothetical protein